MSRDREMFRLAIDGISDDLRVVKFSGEEALSRPYKFEVELICENDQLKFEEIIANNTTLTLESQTSSARYINGIINCISQSTRDSRFTTYQIEIVPQVWLLSYSCDMRIFQEKTVEQIIKQVLQDAKLSLDGYEFSLQSSYEKRKYCVQYQESDLDFVSRLLEEEGIHYYFRHNKNSHVMIMADNSSVHQEIEFPHTVSYHLKNGLNDPEEFISDINFSQNICSNSISLNDYNYLKPALNLLAEKDNPAGYKLHTYKYPALYQTPEQANKLIQRRLDVNRIEANEVNGKSLCSRFIPGYRFNLEGFNRDEFNTEYLITYVSHFGTQAIVKEEYATCSKADYGNEFRCMSPVISFQPSSVKRKHVVTGTQSAIVTGPLGEDIYTDKYGRIKVKFIWDRKNKFDETSSCWLRVSQVSAGAGIGALFLPRVGQEVIVSFEEGNPDRPIVTGCVYHGTNLPPHELPENKTMSVIKTKSSPNGGGHNELSFDDKEQQEKILLRAQKDMEFRVLNNKSELIKSSSFDNIGLSKDILVGGAYSLSVGLGMTESVVGDRYEKVVENKHVLVGRDYNVTIEGVEKSINDKKKINIVKAKTIQKVKGSLYLESDEKIELKVGSSLIKIDKESISIKSNKIKLNGQSLNMSAKDLFNIKGRFVRIN